MTDSAKPRRGRPPGSKDSYPRYRACKKIPPPTTVELVMPAIRELIDIAELSGYHRGTGRPNKGVQSSIERATARLLAALKMAMDNNQTEKNI